MNPILEAVTSYVRNGTLIHEMEIDNIIQPTNVHFVFAGGERANLPVICDLETFVGWWKQACLFVRIKSDVNMHEFLESDRDNQEHRCHNVVAVCHNTHLPNA